MGGLHRVSHWALFWTRVFLDCPRNHLTSQLWVNTSCRVLREVSAFLRNLRRQNGKGLWPRYTLTLNPPTWRIRWAPNNASKWHMGFNSAFKVLIGGGGAFDTPVWLNANILHIASGVNLPGVCTSSLLHSSFSG